jgi:hypothetical protein
MNKLNSKYVVTNIYLIYLGMFLIVVILLMLSFRILDTRNRLDVLEGSSINIKSDWSFNIPDNGGINDFCKSNGFEGGWTGSACESGITCYHNVSSLSEYKCFQKGD